MTLNVCQDHWWMILFKNLKKIFWLGACWFIIQKLEIYYQRWLPVTLNVGHHHQQAIPPLYYRDASACHTFGKIVIQILETQTKMAASDVESRWRLLRNTFTILLRCKPFILEDKCCMHDSSYRKKHVILINPATVKIYVAIVKTSGFKLS